MRIQVKTMFIVLPLILASLLVNACISYLLARNGITGLAIEYLDYKHDELEKYAKSQWDLLDRNDLSGNRDYVKFLEGTIEEFAKSLVRTDTELIFAVRRDLSLAVSTEELNINEKDRKALEKITGSTQGGWQKLTISGENRVCQVSWFDPMKLFLFVTEREDTFYLSSTRILSQSMLTLGITIAVSVIMLFFLTRLITRPVGTLSAVMEEIIKTGDLNSKVEVSYNDEIGRLGHTFNIMTAQLNRAYEQIREFAHKTVLSKSRETYIRNIFQKYVPKNVIDQFNSNPDATLIGEEKNLAVLYSDVHGFSDMLENGDSYQVISCLSDYFDVMVKIIMAKNGIADKYIGDRMIAFFGAPIEGKNDALNAVQTAFEMIRALEKFNVNQKMKNMPEFEIGIGISYGKTVVGNLGCDMKMDYTIIGRPVNLSAQMEKLTRIYNQPVIISEELFKIIGQEISCRMLDTIHFSRLNKTIRIYAPEENISEKKKLAFKYHKDGLKSYYQRDFDAAKEQFLKVKDILLDDVCAEIFIQRCEKYLQTAPDDVWNGTELFD